MNFCFEGEVNNKRCNFRIDTGSDISILNDDLVGSDDFKVKINNCNLKYPTGEKVAIDYGKAPKLQSSWEGPYCVERKLRDIVYCICKSNRYKNKIVHIDRLAPYLERPVE
ncbi:hypothetical protein ALC57_00375 [Trachymyrmex cornetzi]|uniref:Integrase p58-like C-terminal domain-containing protein n=1 Tax=Trachymyrmex cornetzi TaxID=471704 RepID=A0A151JS07_9HYME|nr:hypothetical protein ALC57_00375 [Trachymyrmex cornetzi]